VEMHSWGQVNIGTRISLEGEKKKWTAIFTGKRPMCKFETEGDTNCRVSRGWLWQNEEKANLGKSRYSKKLQRIATFGCEYFKWRKAQWHSTQNGQDAP